MLFIDKFVIIITNRIKKGSVFIDLCCSSNWTKWRVRAK
ncbi:hypothetical protein VSDKYIMU_CDS0100 [Enterococcus phage VRE9_4]